jgi:hypothetical protein
MADIFISYRRDDSSGHALHLHDRLSQRFGRERIFMDIDAIPPGVDFNAEIDRVLRRCAVVLVVIGRRWMDSMGQWRQRDYMKEEIIAALARGAAVRVVPVLVDGATLPDRYRLPADLQPLLNRHAFEISNRSFAHDTTKLINAIARAVAPKAPPGRKPRPQPAAVKRPGAAAGPEKPKQRPRKAAETPAAGQTPRPAKQGAGKPDGPRKKSGVGAASDRRNRPGAAPPVPKPRQEPPQPKRAADGQQKREAKGKHQGGARPAAAAAGAKSPAGKGRDAARRGPAPGKQSKPPSQPRRGRPEGGNAKPPAAKQHPGRPRKRR